MRQSGLALAREPMESADTEKSCRFISMRAPYVTFVVSPSKSICWFHEHSFYQEHMYQPRVADFCYASSIRQHVYLETVLVVDLTVLFTIDF